MPVEDGDYRDDLWVFVASTTYLEAVLNPALL